MTSRHGHAHTNAYPLWNNGSFVHNTKARRLLFMRAGDPNSEREELQAGSYFFVEGDDIKLLYQVLHAHFQSPHVVTRRWSPHAPPPENPKFKVSNGYNRNVLCEDPHENWEEARHAKSSGDDSG